MKYIIHRELKSDVTLMASEAVDGATKVRTIPPDRSQAVINHSPDGFEFGYHGSGPAQLALAILLDFTKDPVRSANLHQAFKDAFIARMPEPGGEILDATIERWLSGRKQ